MVDKMQIDLVRNQIGGMANDYLTQGAVSPKEMRYILKAIIGEVAEMELTQNYIEKAQKQKQEMAQEVEEG